MLVRLVYLDESGISSKLEEPYLVVGGVIVHGDHQLAKVETALEAVLERHIPEGQRYGLVFHSGNIYGGYGKFFDRRKNPGWTIDKRLAILSDIALIFEKANILTVSGFVERAKFPLTYTPAPDANLTVEAHLCAFMGCALEVEMWMRQNTRKEHCMIVAEDNREARRLIKESLRGLQDKKVAESQDPAHAKYFPLRHIKEDPAFQEKRPSHPLILADFVSFFMKRKLMGDAHAEPFYRKIHERTAALRFQWPQN
jgi:hypothetical protein